MCQARLAPAGMRSAWSVDSTVGKELELAMYGILSIIGAIVVIIVILKVLGLY